MLSKQQEEVLREGFNFIPDLSQVIQAWEDDKLVLTGATDKNRVVADHRSWECL